MISSVELLLLDLVDSKLNDSQNGLIVKIGDTINIDSLFAMWKSETINNKLHVAIIGKGHNIKSNDKFEICNEIEKAVEWRSIPSYAGKIIVFLFGVSDKLHSLSEFDTITTRDLSIHLIGYLKSISKNEPITEFWAAIMDNISSFSFKSLYEYISHISLEDHNLFSSIIENMWRLNLLKDDKILDAKIDVGARLKRNQEIRLQISSLNSESQNRLNKTIHNFKSENNSDDLLNAYKKVKEYSRYGNIDVLKNIDYTTVELLLSASRPVRNKNKKTIVPSIEGDKKVLRGKELSHVINQSILSDEPTDLVPLEELLELHRKRSNDIENGDDDVKDINHLEGKFNGNTVLIDSYDKNILSLVNRTCTNDIWGGVLHANGLILKEIILEEDNFFYPFKPNDNLKPLNFNNEALFDLIRSLDDYLSIEVSIEDKFSPLIDTILIDREILCSNIDQLLYNPNLLFCADKKVLGALFDYIEKWDSLIKLYNENESRIREKSQQAAHYIGRSLLSLDSLYIKTSSGDWKVIILPLHPLYLWRYYEIFKLVAKKEKLSTDDKDIFARKLSEIPNLINFVVVDKMITNEQDTPLPHSGNIGVLPTFENKTNRYLGTDGVDYLSDVVSRWISYAPYTTNEIRIALIDTPDLISSIKSIKELLITGNCFKIILFSFYTHGQNATGELIRIEYESSDSDISDLIKKGKLEIRVFSKNINDIECYLHDKPVHISFYFDQSTYQIQYGKQTSFLHISPLVVSYDYEYDEITRQGSIFPSNDSNDTLIGRYFTLMKYSEYVSSNSYPRPTFNKTIDLDSVNRSIERKCTLWLVVADRTIEHYEPKYAVPIGEKHVGRRNICIWAHEDSRIVAQYDQILRNYAIYPKEDYLKQVLKDFGHIASEGLISIPKYGRESSVESRRKGLLGTIFAAAWYSKKNTLNNEKPLIVSLDSEDARTWLSNPDTNERADLLGLRFDNNSNTLFIEALEVKTRDGNPDEKHATEQVNRMMTLLKEIFTNNVEEKDIFTLSRREILKFQIITECFRSAHDNEWKIRWSKILKDAFNDEKTPFNIDIRALIVHINLATSTGSKEILLDNEQDISKVVLGTKDVQKWIFEDHAELGIQIDEKIDFDETQSEEIKSGNYTQMIDSENQTDSYPISLNPSGFIDSESNPSTINIEVSSKPVINEMSIECDKLSRLFLKACEGFRIKINSCDPRRAIIGYSVIRFFVELQRGQLLDTLINKLDDIGREMSRSGLMVYSIKNSNEVNLDVPLLSRSIVSYLSVYNLIPKITSLEQMPIPIGVTPEGNHIIKDLSTFPHLLIGGSTGSGKTVFLSTLIISLLKTHPLKNDIKIVLMSSGIEDFIRFMDLEQLLTGKVISDPLEGIDTIENIVHNEFESRKNLLIEKKVANIIEYNQISEKKIPPMVIIIDEFADLVDQLNSKNEKIKFYEVIRQIAQIGRKRGVHLVLCTQRPSSDLVPTNIRSLMNTQVALRVNDSSSSRMILGEMGAENLLKHGDLIFKNVQENDKLRAQGYFLSGDDVQEYLNLINN